MRWIREAPQVHSQLTSHERTDKQAPDELAKHLLNMMTAKMHFLFARVDVHKSGMFARVVIKILLHIQPFLRSSSLNDICTLSELIQFQFRKKPVTGKGIMRFAGEQSAQEIALLLDCDPVVS